MYKLSGLKMLSLLTVFLLAVTLLSSAEGRKPIPDYTSITTLINHDNYLPSDYEPSDLVIPKIPRQTYNDTTASLRSEAARALEELYYAATSEGHSFFSVSGYRPYSMQKEIFDEEVARSGYEIAALYIALPGSSEHQSGLAMDISSGRMGGGLYASFGETPEGVWVAQNCHKYGFIIRYPEDKEDITKIAYEPWHLRYVGKGLAARLKRDNLCLEEYYMLGAKYNLTKISIGGEEILYRDAYNINGNNYFKLRDVAQLLRYTPARFDVSWNEKLNRVEITTDKEYDSDYVKDKNIDGYNRSYKPSDMKFHIDGQEKELNTKLIDGYNYIKLRDLQTLFNFRVDWDEKQQLIRIMFPVF